MFLFFGGFMTITYECITKKEKLNGEELNRIVNESNNLSEYMFMNYLERELVKKNGKAFLHRVSDKIQFIMGFILQDDLIGLKAMYDECFDIYMLGCNYNLDYANGFNIVFVVLIHMAKKIVRQVKDYREES